MFSGDYEPVITDPRSRPTKIPSGNAEQHQLESAEQPSPGSDEGEPAERESDEPESDESGVPPRELTPDLPPSPDNRQRSTNHGQGFDGATATRRRTFAAGASGRVARQRRAH